MDQTYDNRNGGYPQPPPYSPGDHGQSSYTGMSYDVSSNSQSFLLASKEKKLN